MKPLVLVAIALSLVALQPRPALSQSAPSDDVAKFRECDALGAQALSMGRVYMLGGRKKESVLRSVDGDPQGQALATELFRRVDAGEITHYADFATDQLYACTSRVGANLGKPRELTRLCYARVDIPFFLDSWRRSGLSKEDAIAKTSTVLKDRELYPADLVAVIADQVYSISTVAELRKAMSVVFWTCVYHTEWRQDSH